MAKESGLSWQRTSCEDGAVSAYGGLVSYWTDGHVRPDVTGLDEFARERQVLLTDTSFTPPEVEPLSAWAKCPACADSRYHLLGERQQVPTGRRVRHAVMDEFPAATRTQADATQPLEIRTRVEWGFETQEQITRECRSCGHQWQQATGQNGVRRG
ncbi:hypothetical protein [Umezawaea tangerina]|uniref:Uncharacterized protein n=1 Tax=Umezawaea tangerina TaxID=84725 RepID=A0A2T0SPN3_9PSEU|nr:hypothetical protein [Umezawaea tangerina]PRY35382.1 hypothetical protein CLV43_114300 [Umezawaea tangerina]